YAYVGGDSLWVFNVTDPTNPIPEPTLSHAAFDVFEHDGLLYATGGQDVEVFSLSQPDKPVLVGTIPSFARKIDVNAGVAYLASGSLGFVTADVSNPASTVVLAGRPLGGELERVWAFRDVVLAQEEPGWSYRGIHVFDASDPANLVETKFLQGEYAADAALVGSHLFLVSRTPLSPDLPGLRVYQLSEAGPPPLIAGDPTVGSSIEVVDNHIFVLNGEDLSIFEFTDSSINLLATHSIPGAEEFAVDAGLAFVVAGAQGLLVLDVNDPVNLREVGRFDDVFYAWDVEVDGRFAFVADEKVLSGLFLPGVRQIDAADPSNLVEVDSARIGTIRHKGMSTDGQILGVAQAPSDLLVFLADDLGLVGGQDDGYKVGAYTVQDVAVTNGHIFVAYEEAGLHVLRVDSKPVGIDVAAPRPSRPSLHSLDPPYPHPFQRHVTISWTLGRSGWVSLKIVDVLGREVTTSGRQLMAPGRHSYTWAPRGTASGHYFIILEVDGKRVSQTLIRRK
ncbi:MAG: hypothetical protein HKN13_08905, partial [Rhodothermales bacterium]|nr:hypothetical protein [Rhodothermales bacterium]